ncbi:hypothetical protein BNJ_00431 [Kaumoebavirus]|uniref:hypothetical protein n=1 Tax=Kaumoebavirus TaxID=1859492 RepID=UPI0009C2380D|nr:hypothetical protein BNJ_00431 [Kaumoebavirus]ARA72244.1 hypothetical protein BNJ_00431 [Kaumoebavirus]
MQVQLIEIELREGDVTLTGSDGEIRIFSRHLELIPYFKALKSFGGETKASYDMKEFEMKDLRGIVGYLHGKFPKGIRESYLVMLDFLQLDMKEMYNSYEFHDISNLPLKWLVRILPTDLGSEKTMSVYKRVVSEGALSDPEIFDWLIKTMEIHKGCWPMSAKYSKLALMKGLKTNDYDLVDTAIRRMDKGKYASSFVMKMCLEHAFLGKEAFLQYTEWMFETQQKNKYDKTLMEELPCEF